MPADGTTVIRIYGFDENASSIGDIGVYLTESSNGGTPSTAYVSDVPFSTYSQGIPYGFTTYATLLSVDSGDFPPPGTAFVEFAFVPLTGGAPDPIDLAALPPEIKVLTNQYYAGGVVEIGAYISGEYALLGSREFGAGDYFGVYTVALTAPELEPASCPPFWQAFLRSREIDICPPADPQHFVALATDTETTVYEVGDLTTAIATLPVGGQRPVFSPDGEWLLIATTLYETRAWTIIDTVPNLHSGNVSFSVDRAMAALVPAGENTPVLVSTADWLPVAGAPTLSGYSILISGALYAAARCVFTPDGKYLVNCASRPSNGLLDLATLSFVSVVDFAPAGRFTNGVGCTAAAGGVVAYTVGSVGPHPYRLADPISASTATWLDSGAQAVSVAVSPDGALIGYDARGGGFTVDGVGYNGGFLVRPTDDATTNGQVFSGEAAGLPFGGSPRRARQAGFSTDGALFAAGEGESTATGANGALLFYTVGTWAPVTPPISTGVVGFDFAARA